MTDETKGNHMKIVIVGCGRLGMAVTNQLVQEGHDITVIDRDDERLQLVSARLDVKTINGNGVTLPVLEEAGVSGADLVIAATANDEVNLLICFIAKKTGAANTIARVRNPEYADIMSLVKHDLGLSMSVNPEMACAREIERSLKFPSVITLDTFAKGKVEILKFAIDEKSPLTGMKLKTMSKFKKRILVCAVERGDDEFFIPAGDFKIGVGDKVSIVGDASHIPSFLSQIGVKKSSVQKVIIAGGGKIGFYLAKFLSNLDIKVTVIENDRKRCMHLAENLPKVEIICGDSTDRQVLEDAGIEDADAFAALTEFDEENIMTSLYVGSMSDAKLVTMMSRMPYKQVISRLNVGSIFSPIQIAAEYILRYVRAMQNSYGSNVETLCKIVDDKAEALEFSVSENSSLNGIPLAELKLKKNVLIGTINRKGNIIIPSGSDCICAGDTVIVVTSIPGLNALEDILK